MAFNVMTNIYLTIPILTLSIRSPDEASLEYGIAERLKHAGVGFNGNME